MDSVSEVYPVFLLEVTHPDYTGALRICASNLTKPGEDSDDNPKYGLKCKRTPYFASKRACLRGLSPYLFSHAMAIASASSGRAKGGAA